MRIVWPRGSATLSAAMITRATGTPLFDGPVIASLQAPRIAAAAATSDHLSRVAIRA